MKLTSSPIPIFRIFDLEKAREFYCDYLGFKVDWEHRFDDESPIYMQVSRGDLKIHLTEHYGDCTPGGAVFIPIDDIEKYQKELSAKKYKYLRPGVETASWHAKLMELLDPFGNRLRFHQELGDDA